MEGKRRREEKEEDAAALGERNPKSVKTSDVTPTPDVKDYILSGRFEEDIRRFFPKHKSKPLALSGGVMPLEPFLQQVASEHARNSLKKFDEIVRQGALPENLDLLEL